MGCRPPFCLYMRYLMINRVKVKIESSIEDLNDAGLPEGDIERDTVEADGFYRYDGGDIHLSYSEEREGGRIRTEIISVGGGVRVVRSGAVDSNMYFSEGESHSSIYTVPPYSLDATVYTRRIRLELDSEGGRIDLLYNIKIGGADRSARMKIWISKPSSQN